MYPIIDVDEAWRSLTFGKYQMVQFSVWFYVSFMAWVHVVSIVFLGYRPPYQCADVNISSLQIDNWSPNLTYTVLYDKCDIRVSTAEDNTTDVMTSTCPNGYSYDGHKTDTLVTEFDLVCDRFYLAELSQVLYMVGLALGATFVSQLADRLGRKPLYQACSVSFFILSLAQAFAPNIYVLLALRFCAGLVWQGSSVSYSLFMEIMPMELRYLIEVMGMVVWVTTLTSLAGWGYLFKDIGWRYLQIALTSGLVLSLGMHLVLDESVRWLLANGKYKEAHRILKKAARWNKKNYTEVIEQARLKAIEMDIIANGDIQLQNGNIENTKEQSGDNGQLSNENNSENVKFLNNSELIERNVPNTNPCEEDDSCNIGTHNEKKNNLKPTELAQNMSVIPPVVNLNNETLLSENLNVDHMLNGSTIIESKAPLLRPQYQEVDDMQNDGSAVQEKEPDIHRYSALSIMKDRRIFINSLIVWYAWITDSFVYMGMTLSSASFSGDRFVNFALMGLVEYVVIILEITLLNRIGRKYLTMGFHSASTIFLLATTLLNHFQGDNPEFAVINKVIMLIGKLAITGSFSVMWVYTPEMYPTNMRTVGMALAMTLGRIGGVVAPFTGAMITLIPWGPGVLFSAMCFVATCLLYLLPETMGHELPTTIDDLKKWHRGRYKAEDNKSPES